ncbi:gliding motility-associated C-terminal domain-containing protein [Hymenobacter sp. BT186]|uniref:Gliding motility-associated C-terminal domain-containing protein n=1 Tax=Hymenobacter telluris TaxID=2816474 RepID=A0A939JDT2_9BACT|nr:PKD domain-containing protein [Hymenobacter telluris]MBO0359725.1 gliding motility-associated C-terminal domain-containing protein [Hymenobacter telluris]MBW3375752.1 gliding motility-associated C-terminal domain-containing protein [Hymenobacter norwichensis]
MPNFTLLKQQRNALLLSASALVLAATTPVLADAGPGKVAAPTPTRQLQFVANRNQWEKPVLFATDVPGGRLYLEQGRLMQALYDTKAVEELHHHKPDGRNHRIKAHAYSVTFVGANQQALVKGTEQTGEVSNYFLGKDQSKWASNVPSFGEVRYQRLYPGTDLRFYTSKDHLEYDFELAAGADAKQIKLRYEGPQKMSIVKGALHIATSVGEVVEQSPVAYQVVGDKKVPVACRYVLSANNTLSFAFPNDYNHALPLVIDPILVYSSYTGSSASNYGYTATYDAQGNLYAGGVVFSSGYPTTTGAYDVSFAGSQDYGIMKFDPTAGTRQGSRIYATYVGGASDDHPHSMVVDPAGNLVILGSTSSSDFPTTTGAYDPTYNSGSDIVVSKLNPTGTQLLASTFLGGSADDGQVNGTLDKNYNDTYRGDVTTDPQGNIYLATLTSSTNFPSMGGFQAAKSGGSDAAIVKFNPTLTGLVWSSFLGGSGDDAAYSVQVDSTGTVFVSGGTTSTNFPGTLGGLNRNYLGGSSDGFVARIVAAGNDLFQASYVGTSGYDQAYFLQLDRQGEVYLFGQTDGAYPVSAGVYSNPNSLQFIHKLDRLLTTTRFSTVIGNGAGNSTNISPTAFLVDNCGQILLSGFGGDIANMPITGNAIQSNASGTSGNFGYFYIMQLSANASGLVYGTYFGNGSCHVDGGTSRFDKKGIIYQSMCVGSGSVTLPTTANAWSASNSSSWNNAAFKIDVLQLDATFTPSNVPGGSRLRTGCAPFTVFFTRPSVSGTTTSWNFGNGQTSSAATPFVSTTYTNPGRYVVRLTITDPSNCIQSATATDTIQVFGLPRAAIGPDKVVCEGGSVTLSVPDAGPGVTYSWFPPLGLNTTTGRTVVASPTGTTFYILTATTPNNCIGKDTVVVSIAPRPQVTVAASATQEFTGTPVAFSATIGSTGAGTPTSYLWNFGDGSTSTEQNPSHTYATAEPNGTNYRVTLTTKYGPGGACEVVSNLTVFVREAQRPNVITPNGDGKNDTFRPFLTFQPVDMKIFNRWGRKVYEQSNYTDGWGTDNVPAGVYYYQLTSATGESWKGWVEVVR